MFTRFLHQISTALPMRSSPGVGLAAALRIAGVATDAAVTLTTDQMAGGMVQYTGFSAGRNITTPTGTQIETANPGMNVGDSFSFFVSITTAFAGTWVAGSGVTLAGRATTPASSWSLVTVIKTATNTFTWNVS